MNHLDETITNAKKLQGESDKSNSIVIFEKTRSSYKKVEPFLTYIVPKKVHGINGPPLPVYKEDSGKVLPAIGFQAIGEQLYSDEEIDSGLYQYRIEILIGYLEAIKEKLDPITLKPRHFFTSIHQQFLGIFSLGIISFDTPSSLRGLEESIISLSSIKDVYEMSLSDTLKNLDNDLHVEFMKNIDNAVFYLKENDDFDNFNRYEFTRNHINPLTSNWRDIRKKTGLFGAPKNIAVNLDAPTFFEENSFHTDYFTGLKTTPSRDQVLLGKKLYFDEKLSASGNLSCATCHQPNNAYQDGLRVGIDKNGNPLKRNTPTVINSVYQRKFFWDGRSDNLVQQINQVFDNEMEFGQSMAHDLKIVDLDSEEYDSLFAKAFPDSKKMSRRSVVRSISAYVSTLNGLNSRFDKNMRGESNDFTNEEVLGMNLYMGKALCATCHFLPLTSGTVPPLFRETEKEIIGTPETAENKEVDGDVGFYWVFQEDIHKYMF
ncbi:MAG: cytochrome-c peroxidase, partial [Bacteroidota bacterium]